MAANTGMPLHRYLVTACSWYAQSQAWAGCLAGGCFRDPEIATVTHLALDEEPCQEDSVIGCLPQTCRMQSHSQQPDCSAWHQPQDT